MALFRASTRRSSPRATVPRAREFAAGPVDHEEPENEDQSADHSGDREDPPERPRALVVAGGATHEDPHAVEPAQQRKRPEHDPEQTGEGDDQAEAAAARTVVALRAEP